MRMKKKSFQSLFIHPLEFDVTALILFVDELFVSRLRLYRIKRTFVFMIMD